tara:strand:- start:3620 stop:6511 length:2892 start_codon:yes stop_codon:yes gene_type:complete
MNAERPSCGDQSSPESYDFGIFGGGYIGFSAAVRLRRMGYSVLLIEPSGQLLWESTAALQNSTAGSKSSCGGLMDWLNWKGCRLKPTDPIDPVRVEILAASELLEESDSGYLDTMFYISPVRVSEENGYIRSVTFASKNGYRRFRAKQWLDTSEDGTLIRCWNHGLGDAVRLPISSISTMALQSTRWTDVEEKVSLLVEGMGMKLGPSAVSSERLLRWKCQEQSWSREIRTILGAIRRDFPSDKDFSVSHVSMRSFPVYDDDSSCGFDDCVIPGNLRVLSPSLSSEGLETVSDRFELGLRGAYAAASSMERSVDSDDVSELGEESLETVVQTTEVLVAGAGTAGAMAAIASARSGVETTVLENFDFPGGVGTMSGISCYFYGLPGGLQSEIDVLADDLSALLLGRKSGSATWHPVAKMIALLDVFEESGVRFIGGSLLCGVRKLESGRVESVFAARDGRLIEYRAQSFVDSTGDADLCAFAGAKFTVGRVGDHRCLAYSQAALTVRDNGESVVVRNQNFDAGWLDACTPEDLTRARLIGIAQYAGVSWDRGTSLRSIAPALGVRQSRSVETEYRLRLDDLLCKRDFPDSIGSASAHADTHSVDIAYEDDQAVFFYWVCRLFRHQLVAQLPYRMLLPKNLENVWVACRAAGMENNVFYAIRMQRDMQRLGEVAGRAAAIAARLPDPGRSRAVHAAVLNPCRLQPSARGSKEPVNLEDILRSDGPSTDVWEIYRDPDSYRAGVEEALDCGDSRTSFTAACILAMWEDPKAEDRLLSAIRKREVGITSFRKNRGAYGQEIDVPFWVLAVVLLRRCGSEECLEPISRIVEEIDCPLPVKCAVALTVERLLSRGSIDGDKARSVLRSLLRHPVADLMLPPSYSMARQIRNEPQMVLPNDVGADVSESHVWQLDLVLARIERLLGLPLAERYRQHLKDPRGFVRCAFETLSRDEVPRAIRPIPEAVSFL